MHSHGSEPRIRQHTLLPVVTASSKPENLQILNDLLEWHGKENLIEASPPQATESLPNLPVEVSMKTEAVQVSTQVTIQPKTLDTLDPAGVDCIPLAKDYKPLLIR
ncbi:hypothetical protein JTE90_018481 [Oedothorax gibbosus]|uniref:Uncharacterized protein n=1 Tax=Oedothorax gibbosus TaxID=931172 RepID=A0AAV6UGE7_9ARAC|nr:hypothetical protein JTE90_018481 [Oedothorax gibbosus]